MKRIALNEHDGYHARVINEEKLYEYLKGHFSQDDIVPKEVNKRISIDISYYNWTPPTIKGNTFVSRVSSPLQFDAEGKHNPISQKEIYVPLSTDMDMGVYYQIIGNFGGYANKEYNDDTSIIMLSDEVLNKLKKGIKDEVIYDIENRYNNSNTPIFNIQFTSESDFINWVKRRMEIYPDIGTMNLLNIYDRRKVK